jgi:uncharacterized protein involved in exopolysaccharide biosynthesis
MSRLGVPDPEGEREVDLASAWERLKTRWWLPAVGLAAGAIVGLVLALSGGEVYQANTLVYLGQPFAPLGGGQIQSLATNPRTVSEIVHSESALRDASGASGVSLSRLRSSVSTKEITAPGQVRGVNPLIEISVKASGRRKAEQAAESLANRVVEGVSAYVADKVELLQDQVAVSESQLQAVTARIQQAQEQQAALVRDRSLSAELRVLLSVNLNATITTADARRTALQEQLYDAQQLLILARSVESSRVVEPAAAAKTTARSSRTSLLVGALIGLLLGAVAALAAEPIVARRRSASTD